MNEYRDAQDPADSLVVVHGPALTSYTFGEQHPLQPSRHELTVLLLSMLGWLDAPGVTTEAPRSATLSQLLFAHTLPYIQAVQTAQAVSRGERPPLDLRIYGLGTDDNPLFPYVHDAPALVAGASIQAMQTILEGCALHAYSPAGGMHHAMRARASGFCIYNDVVAAIVPALEAGRRVAYLDLDAHHGDGVQAAFYEDPRVLTISVHESGEYLFPGTGSADEIGAGDGLGACLNVPLPPRAGDESILLAYHQIVEPALRTYSPDIVVTQTGCDTHHADPLTDLAATMRLYPELGARLHALVHEICGGRWLIVGGGGYDPADVTPRAWTAFMGPVLGRDVEDLDLPADWRRASHARGGDPPVHLLDDPGAPPSRAPDPAFVASLVQIEKAALAVLRERFGEKSARVKGS